MKKKQEMPIPLDTLLTNTNKTTSHSNNNSNDSKTTLSSTTSSSVIPSTTSSVIPSSTTSSVIPSSTTTSSSNTETIISKEELEQEYEKLDCKNEKYYSTDCNKFILKKEALERTHFTKEPNDNLFLYPNLNDPNFNIKIASKKEFNDTKYDGTIYEDIKKQADILAKADFELQPHQAFVKNFMSFQTPYSSLLLFHGLGSGKTCSAIGVCEEMRDYMKQTGVTKRIIIVATENVQDNFKLQLFNEKNLKLVDGIWNIKSCVGNKLLKEINPMNMKGLSKDKVISQIKNLINTYYIFLGYIQFANYIIKTIHHSDDVAKEIVQTQNKKDGSKKREPTRIELLKEKPVDFNKSVIKRLQNEFNNRMIVIDEIHNIRKTDDNENKKVAVYFEILVKYALNMRLLFLSATPMYNSYKEIIWLLNIMNMNDRRGRIDIKDVFDKNGNIKESGKEILKRKATGYISFVRGENPYTFPYRVYPNEFAPDNTFSDTIKYPLFQMNQKKIKPNPNIKGKKRVLSLYLTPIRECGNCGACQYCAYKYIIYNLRNKNFSVTTKTGITREMPNFATMEKFGYTLLQTPIESLIISYPINGLKTILDQMPEEKYSNEEEEIDSEESQQMSEVEDEDKTSEEVIFKKKGTTEENADEDKEDDDKESINDDDNYETIVNTDTADVVKSGGTKKASFTMFPPQQLTGKLGLARMMNYVDDYQFKGDFEYKKTTLKEYKQIFSQPEIGKYSAKIKSVLDNIVNPDTGQVSEGIILIYSQYLDSGLIPMALALEELGFIRYGQKSKQLFKTPPSPGVDVRTMKPRNSQNKDDFIPACYTMITGEPRLSPDNKYEVKNLTDDANKNGYKVKVVLISKAGSEGIDLKFIRQVHILDPWYNMNRIEQIIGRAVRNFSHKDLPFEKRNVEIFMYATILGNNKEEAADLYVYRIAEFKAIQIGKITRILKETSVDCIINHDQNNFTQTILNANLKEPITQELSNKKVMTNFKIGDAPFSPACDYMADCNYDCDPTKTISVNELNEDTYDEKFIIINSDKILQKIRMLFKEGFFYKKDILIKAIQTPKTYPYVQIYSALTQLIEDKTEFITDKYGRNGRLVNIGEYYLFQPIELNDKNASIFERSVPIDYKHEMIQFAINKKLLDKDVDKAFEKDVDKRVSITEEALRFTEGKKLVEEMKKNYDTCIDFTRQHTFTKIDPKLDASWYKYCGLVFNKMAKEYPGSFTYLPHYLVAHMIELFLFSEKLEVMNFLYSLESIKKDTLEWFAKEYFQTNSISTNNSTFFIMYNLKKSSIMKLNRDNIWINAEPSDIEELFAHLNKIVSNTKTKQANTFIYEQAEDILKFNSKNYNDIVGFIGYEKHNKYLIFKTKNMLSKRDTGAICDSAGKDKNLAYLNAITGETKYTNEYTKTKKNINGKIVNETISKVELCILQEFILRYFNTIKQNDKKWFLTPEMTIFHKLYTIFE